MKNKVISLFFTAIILFTAACEQEKPVAPAGPDTWLGRWVGPEGTYLDLSREGERFVIAINSLDGVEMFEGTAGDGRIDFERAGRVESIRAGSGADTGMKWLFDKENCLVIRSGEGFCR